MQKDYAFGTCMLFVMAALMTALYVSVNEARAGEGDTELTVVARSDTDQLLARKRFISVYDCRRERDWLFTLLARTGAEPVFIVCAPEQPNG